MNQPDATNELHMHKLMAKVNGRLAQLSEAIAIPA